MLIMGTIFGQYHIRILIRIYVLFMCYPNKNILPKNLPSTVKGMLSGVDPSMSPLSIGTEW